MTATIDPTKPVCPLWLKIFFTLFVGTLVPIYWRDYGPANFLWFCDMGLLVTVAALWLDSSLLLSTEAVALTMPQSIWIADFVTGGRILGISQYMFSPAVPLFTRLLSTFHIWLPILLILLVRRNGYDGRAVWLQIVISTVTLILCYLVTDPRHPPVGYPAAAVNVNRVYGIHAADVQTWMPPLVFLGLEILFWPLIFYLPTHLIFRKMFRTRQAASSPKPVALLS